MALRDVDTERFEAQSVGLDQVAYRRARHVVTENDRTLLAVEAMYNEDAVQLGQLMNASHASLRDDFQVSSSELDTMVSCALNEQGCYGARMTGAGFGGCAVALIEAETSLAFSAHVAASYEAATGITPGVYLCSATKGAQIVAGV